MVEQCKECIQSIEIHLIITLCIKRKKLCKNTMNLHLYFSLYKPANSMFQFSFHYFIYLIKHHSKYKVVRCYTQFDPMSSLQWLIELITWYSLFFSYYLLIGILSGISMHYSKVEIITLFHCSDNEDNTCLLVRGFRGLLCASYEIQMQQSAHWL